MEPLDILAGRLGVSNPHAALQQNWEPSQAEYPGRTLAFQDERRYTEACRMLGMPPPFLEAVRRALPEVARQEDLSRYLWLCRWVLGSPRAQWPFMGAGFPPVAAETSPAAHMGFALVELDLLETAFGRYRKRGVPEAVIRDTFDDFPRWVEEHRRKRNDWGLTNLGWMQHHLRARIFKLGRLQFKMETYGYDFHAWRSRSTGRVLVMADAGMRVHAGGFALADPDRAERFPDEWKAEYREAAGDVAGNPIDPRGKIIRRTVVLPRPEWEPVLGRGDRTIGIHIPAGAPMDFDACGDSFAQVGPFFARHVPDHPARVLTCGSWLLDPQFEGRLSDSSNIVRFLREPYLHPIPGATDAGLFDRVFDGRRPGPEESLAGMSSLQKAVLEHGRSGGAWRGGGALLFLRDMDWGQQVYRRMWPEPDVTGL